MLIYCVFNLIIVFQAFTEICRQILQTMSENNQVGTQFGGRINERWTLITESKHINLEQIIFATNLIPFLWNRGSQMLKILEWKCEANLNFWRFGLGRGEEVKPEKDLPWGCMDISQRNSFYTSMLRIEEEELLSKGI